ncbi:uncharacterized protein yc1106_06495 [Curvularia clavata]|uniref:Heterokaryon incompatibility domain-containing protein n=1 Tax=Curvularia clavata TaxID=95742 RepID=A0A9Q9DV98_CURCL|nr:uncharacterized protein yc1106_06495 [Curvularia clavata]
MYGRNCEVYSPHTQEHVWNIPHLPQELQVSSYTGSNHAIKRTQLWLRECEETHLSCNYSKSPLPSRVLLIRGPQQVELYESNRETVPYACLSHCWGKKHIIRTTKATLQHHKQSISWKRLPLTFRQAISFTYRLGLKHLWIDSLCIIQDDVEDWRFEGSKMSQIYSGAYITLAATASRDASGGCFVTPPTALSSASHIQTKKAQSRTCAFDQGCKISDDLMGMHLY